MINVITIYQSFVHGLMKVAGMTQKSVEIEAGTILHFWVPKKTTKKQAVVFLHGFAINGILTWKFQVLALAKTYAVYVPDILFFGGSVTDRPDRTVMFQGECIAKGLRKLGVEKCTVVGLSYGGTVGFKMAEMYPDLVESLVVTGSLMALTESVSNACLERIGFASFIDYLLPKTANGVKILFDIAGHNLPSLPGFICKDILEVMFDHRKERIELLEALITSDKEFNVPHFSQKIHILCGENDRIFNMKDVWNMKRQLGEKAVLESIDKTAHLPNLERPFVYNRHLKRILVSVAQENGQHNATS